jgi:rhodanese-related sulfurtransferase
MTTKERSWQNKIFFQILFIILLSTVTGLIFNYFSGDGLPLIYHSAVFSSSTEISAEQALQLLLEGKALFIDTRYPEEFAQGHIKQAVNVPAKWSMDQIMNFFESIPKDRLLVVYCSSADCNSSQRLAGFLAQQEFSKVMVFLDGYEIWVARNYPRDLPGKNTGK